MKSKLLSLAAVAALAIGFASSGAQAQSSKFNATWATGPDSVKADTFSGDVAASFCTGEDSGTGTSGDPCIASVAQLATIDIAQQKDALIGVSGQIGLVTFTQAKGKNTDPTLGSATASAGVEVKVVLVETGDDASVPANWVQVAAPGTIVFSSRLQELKVDLGATAEDFYTEVIVSLLLDTTAAHHFNFIGVDLDQGVYDVVAIFDLSAFVAVAGEDAIASAEVILGPRIVTVQEVRAAKDTLVALP